MRLSERNLRTRMQRSFQLGGTEVEVESRSGILRWDGREIQTPPISWWGTFDGALLLCTEVEYDEQSDFTVPAPERNVVRFDGPSGPEWFVETDDAYASEVGEYRHDQLYMVNRRSPRMQYYTGDRLVSKVTLPDAQQGERSGHFFEIGVETGSIDDRWPATSFKVGDEEHEFDAQVEHAFVVDDVTIVVTFAGRGSKLYGFGPSGEQLWTKNWHVQAWYPRLVDDGIVQFHKSDRRPKLRIDVRTGERP